MNSKHLMVFMIFCEYNHNWPFRVYSSFRFTYRNSEETLVKVFTMSVSLLSFPIYWRVTEGLHDSMISSISTFYFKYVEFCWLT